MQIRQLYGRSFGVEHMQCIAVSVLRDRHHVHTYRRYNIHRHKRIETQPIICTHIYSIVLTRSSTYTHGHPRKQVPIRVHTHMRTRAQRRCRRAQWPRRIEDRPSASAAVRVRRPKAAHTVTMFDTAAVFQSAIGPYVAAAAVGSVTHAVTAGPKFASVMTVCAATCAGRKRSSARPARRCDRNVAAQLHRKRHNAVLATRDVLHRRAT
jgi:hypothetical protein